MTVVVRYNSKMSKKLSLQRTDDRSWKRADDHLLVSKWTVEGSSHLSKALARNDKDIFYVLSSVSE